jgi:acetylornithine deacetylase/succinyl-diaminopimelate desuccinylase
MAGTDDALRAAVEGAGWEGLLADMVRTPSHPGLARQEEPVVRVLAAYLEAHGIGCEIIEVAPGRPNLLASLGPASGGRHLLLCGHTDTVPLNAGDPGVGFSAETREGSMYGRGTADMKGGLAAMAACMVALGRTGALPAGRVTLAAVADEEMESLGTEHLVTSGFRADGAIVGEPTGNRLHLGHRGLQWLEVEFHGRAAHGGMAQTGINAIAAAARFMTRVEHELVPSLAPRTHALLGPPTINFGTIEGGDQPSTVARRCRLTLDRRSVPGETFETITAELERLLRAVEAEMPGLATTLARVPGGMATMDHGPTVVDADHPLARAVAAACEAVTGARQAPGAFPAWTDAALLANFGGIPAVVLGPGDLAVAHSPREFVPLAEVAAAARIYAAAALRFCAGTDASAAGPRS